MLKAYLAARFSRKEEMAQVADRLASVGIQNIASWVTGKHDFTGVPDESIPVSRQVEFAKEDLAEIHEASMVIVFTDEPGNRGSRGGRDVEFGFSLAIGKAIVIIGPLQNIFYSFAMERKNACHFDDLDTFLEQWGRVHRAQEVLDEPQWRDFQRFL